MLGCFRCPYLTYNRNDEKICTIDYSKCTLHTDITGTATCHIKDSNRVDLKEEDCVVFPYCSKK